MAYDYGNDQWFGTEYKRALMNGDQAYAASLQAKMDANPHPYSQQVNDYNSAQVGMINAKMADMGRGTNVFANGGNGLEYNTQGQMRTPGVGAINTTSGRHSYAVNPGQVQNGPLMTGQFSPTPTNSQYRPEAYSRGGMGMPVQNFGGYGSGAVTEFRGAPMWRGQTPSMYGNNLGFGRPQMPSQPRQYGQQPYQQQGAPSYGTQATPYFGGVNYRRGLLGRA